MTPTPAPAVELVARPGHDGLLDLPWTQPLLAWDDDRIVDIVRGVSRHTVRFVDVGGTVYAVKETGERAALAEYELLRSLEDRHLPVVEPVGVARHRVGPDGTPLEAALITRHLTFSLPYRYLFAGRSVAGLRHQLTDALALLLVKLHLEGFVWGDCSLSNTLFRRDAGALTAYLVDAETGTLHPGRASDGQRAYDLETATENIGGELMDLQARDPRTNEVDPARVGDDLRLRYSRLWDELTRAEVIPAASATASPSACAAWRSTASRWPSWPSRPKATAARSASSRGSSRPATTSGSCTTSRGSPPTPARPGGSWPTSPSTGPCGPRSSAATCPARSPPSAG